MCIRKMKFLETMAVTCGFLLATVSNQGFVRPAFADPPADSDGDGLPDAYELTYGLDPSDPSDAVLDPDLDGLTNLDEFFLGTDPTNPDTDGDGLPDGYELTYGLDPSDPSDAELDLDADGLTSLDEFQLGTDPTNPDTDGDGVNDLNDACPNSDMRSSVFVGTIDSGIANRLLETPPGCTLADTVAELVLAAADGTGNDGDFRSRFVYGVNHLRRDGIINQREAAGLIVVAVRANAP